MVGAWSGSAMRPGRSVRPLRKSRLLHTILAVTERVGAVAQHDARRIAGALARLAQAQDRDVAELMALSCAGRFSVTGAWLMGVRTMVTSLCLKLDFG